MLPIKWRGFGILVVPFIIGSGLIVMGITRLFGINVESNNKTVLAVSFVLAAIITSAFYNLYVKPKRARYIEIIQVRGMQPPAPTQLDVLFYIPLAYWPGVLMLIGVIMGIIAILVGAAN